MKLYIVTITMPSGAQGEHLGLYEDGFDAVIRAMELLPDARRISARRFS